MIYILSKVLRKWSRGTVILSHCNVASRYDLPIIHSIFWLRKKMFWQTWKLREEGRLLDIVDPELGEYPEKEVMRFIKVALFCTQAASHQRPDMKQVVVMLSKEVNLNEKLLTEPGVYRSRTSKTLVGGSSAESSSSGNKGKQLVNPSVTSIHSEIYDQSETQMLPRWEFAKLSTCDNVSIIGRYLHIRL